MRKEGLVDWAPFGSKFLATHLKTRSEMASSLAWLSLAAWAFINFTTSGSPTFEGVK